MKPSYYTKWNEMGHKKELFILSISKPDPLIKSQSYPNITENNSKLKKKKKVLWCPFKKAVMKEQNVEKNMHCV